MSTNKVITAVLALISIGLIVYYLLTTIGTETKVLIGEVQQCEIENPKLVLAILKSDVENHDPFVVPSSILEANGVDENNFKLKDLYKIVVAENKVSSINIDNEISRKTEPFDKEIYDDIGFKSLHLACEVSEFGGYHNRRHIVSLGSFTIQGDSTLISNQNGQYFLYEYNDPNSNVFEYYLLNSNQNTKMNNYDQTILDDGVWIELGGSKYRVTLDGSNKTVQEVNDVSDTHEHRQF